MKYFVSFLVIIISCNAWAKKHDYPIASEDRKFEEMGSALQTEGIVIRPTKVKNESTKTKDMPINSYLWQAALEAVSFMPLSSSDAEGGVIITDWYNDKVKPNENYKIIINIKDNVISPQAIDVIVHNRIYENNVWVSAEPSAELRTKIESKILERAREINIETKERKRKKGRK